MLHKEKFPLLCFDVLFISFQKKHFATRHSLADVISVHNGNMKHACAIEFDCTNLLAMLWKLLKYATGWHWTPKVGFHKQYASVCWYKRAFQRLRLHKNPNYSKKKNNLKSIPSEFMYCPSEKLPCFNGSLRSWRIKYNFTEANQRH